MTISDPVDTSIYLGVLRIKNAIITRQSFTDRQNFKNFTYTANVVRLTIAAATESNLLPGYTGNKSVDKKYITTVYYTFIQISPDPGEQYKLTYNDYGFGYSSTRPSSDAEARSIAPPPTPNGGFICLNPQTSSNILTYLLEQDLYYVSKKVVKDANKPCYRHFITGYELDNRIFPTQLTLLSAVYKKIKIGFYRRNKFESVPDLISIDWVSLDIELIANLSQIIDITDIVLGTLHLGETVSIQSNGTMPYDSLLSTGLVSLFTYWNLLYVNDNLSPLPYVQDIKKIHLLSANNNVWNNNPITYTDINYDINHPLFLVDTQRAYNWHINPQSDGSIGNLVMDSPILREIHAALEAAKYKAEVPAVIGTGTADNPQTPAIHTLGYSIANGGGQKLNDIHAALEAAKYKAEVPAVIGTGTVDNPQIPAIHTLGYSIANGGGQKLNDIHAALEAAKYKAGVPAVIGTGTVDNPQIPAIRTLGYSIANGGGQKLNEIHKALDAEKYSKLEGSNIPRVATLGHLISKISAILGYRPEPDGSFIEDTEKKLVRKIVPSTERIDKTKIGINNFGSDGMLLKRLNNRFNGNKIANDECVIVKDLPQLLAEYQDQINLALGLQESSAVEIKNNNETSRYSNQLAMLSELLNLASSNHDMIRAALISSLIAQGQTSETIAALGLPTVTKTLPIDVDGKIKHLPYKGVAPHRSISQEVATCTQNVGIVLGQLL